MTNGTEQNRICAVAEGVLHLTPEEIMAWLTGIVGPGARRAGLTDERMELARMGRDLSWVVLVPHAELSDGFRAYLKKGARNPLLITLHIHPWLVQTGTEIVTDEDGNMHEVPVFERRGTLVDILFDQRDVRVHDLEQALMARALEPDAVTRSDGTVAVAGRSEIGLKLVPVSEIVTPAVVYPVYEKPEVVTEVVVPESGQA